MEKGAAGRDLLTSRVSSLWTRSTGARFQNRVNRRTAHSKVVLINMQRSWVSTTHQEGEMCVYLRLIRRGGAGFGASLLRGSSPAAVAKPRSANQEHGFGLPSLTMGYWDFWFSRLTAVSNCIVTTRERCPEPAECEKSRYDTNTL